MDISDKLKNVLLSLPSARVASGGNEIVCRCPFCGDSSTDRKAAHFYIKIPTSESELAMFHCFRANCQASGIVTGRHLLEWGINNDILTDLAIYNKNALSKPQNMKFKDSQIYRLSNNFISKGELTEVKLKYINTRLDTSLTYQDLLNNKIVLNLKDLLENNNITEYSRDLRVLHDLDESFIGFISQDNAFVNMRNLRPGKVNKSVDRKYVNYNIFGKVDNTMKYYTIPTAIDLNNPNTIRINIAEGAFDILSVYFNMSIDHNHSVYSSILGGGYLGICKHFINTMKLINIEFHIYIDNDVEDYVISNLYNYLSVYNMPLYVHRNMYPGEKDFGVKPSNIQEQILRIR